MKPEIVATLEEKRGHLRFQRDEEVPESNFGNMRTFGPQFMRLRGYREWQINGIYFHHERL